MTPQDPFRQADFHRSTMKSLASSQNPELRQVASALLDIMLWLDANFTDLGELSERISELESKLESASEKIEVLERLLQSH